MNNLCRWLLAVTLSPGPLLAAPPVNEVLNLAGPVLADEELDRLRGGFLQDGLEISIGLDQVVALNGQELIVNRLTIPNLNQKIRGEVAHRMETVVQVLQPDEPAGARVAVGPGIGGSGWTTVIQNSLNSTVIQNIHRLNIELNNLAVHQQVPLHLGEHLNRLLSR
ncbi:hypothetical protein [Marinobacter segnicrescens]|uniref:hypothetical protein n=1 Tax=Marinobacter segnicrescens TaxID=430453 RepID=UPI003A91F241